MNFVFPEFLYALVFLAIPILIHLFNFRRYKTVKFSQIKFLKNVKQETQAVSKLKHILILLSRCFAIISLVLAFSQPFLPAKDKKVVLGKKGVTVYLDNSFSMQLNAEKGNLLDLAKEKAIAIINSYENSDKFHLVTNDFKAKNQRWLNKEQVISEIQNVEVSPIYRSIGDVLIRTEQLQNTEQLKRSKYILSDLQKNSFQIDNLKDSSAVFVIPVQGSVTDNINLSQLKFGLPYHLVNQQESLLYTVKSKEEKKITGQLIVDGKVKSPLSFDYAEQDSVSKKTNYKVSNQESVLGKVVIKDYPVTFDDTLFFNYSIQDKINVIHLFEDSLNLNLSALLSADSLINYRSNDIRKINFELFNSSTLIILDGIKQMSSGLQQELEKFSENGGSICIFPNKEMEVKSFNRMLFALNSLSYGEKKDSEMKVSELNEKSDLFTGVFEELPENINLPVAKFYWQIKSSMNSLKEDILSYQNQDPFFIKTQNKLGSIYLSSVALSEDNSNFSKHALFVPIIYNMALQSIPRQAVYYDLNDQIISLRNIERDESPIHIIGNGIDIIPKQKFNQDQIQINLSGKIRNAGHYQVVRNNEILQSISLNYNRNESELEYFLPEELLEQANILGLNFSILEEDASELKKSIGEIDKGTALWKYFIILALIFLGIEILLLRFMK